MKNIIILSFLLLSLVTRAQIEMVFPKSPSSTLYIGVENPVVIKNPLNKSSHTPNYFIKGENIIFGKIKEKMNIFAVKQGKVKLFLYEIKGKDTVLITQKEVAVKRIANPQYVLGKVFKGERISKELFLSIDKIKLFIDCDYIGFEDDMKIVSYEFTIDKKTIKVESNLITEEIKELVRGSKCPVKVYIESVRAKSREGTRILPDLRLIIY